MQAYSFDYEVKGRKYIMVSVNAKDMKSAKIKLGKKHGYKDGRMIRVIRCSLVGYF